MATPAHVNLLISNYILVFYHSIDIGTNVRNDVATFINKPVYVGNYDDLVF